MTWPAGALLLFYGACPAGWAVPPTNEAPTMLAGNMFTLHGYYLQTAPEKAKWCVKQPEPKP